MLPSAYGLRPTAPRPNPNPQSPASVSRSSLRRPHPRSVGEANVLGESWRPYERDDYLKDLATTPQGHEDDAKRAALQPSGWDEEGRAAQ